MNTEILSEAFRNFTNASKSLENYYETLHKKVRYLTAELEQKNRQLEEAFEEAERNREYLNAILYSLEEAIIVTDPDSRITMLNKSAEQLLDIKPVEAIGRRFRDLNLTITEDAADTSMTINGNQYKVIISRSDVNHPRTPLKGSVILIKDVTRLRELEQHQERNQRLIAMGEMSARIVHEIRNPLCSIALFASMLAKDIAEPSHRELATGISTGIDNLNSILKNMLYFARPGKPSMKKINLKDIAEDSLKMFSPLAKSRKVKVSKNLSEAVVTGDPELLRQVFVNIIVNALQAMPEGGELSVELKDDHAATVMEIRDTGEGIEREILEKIFNPFFSTRNNGTGLGLAIASTIMQSHGGYIRVRSERDKGTAFSLCFPHKEDR